MSVIKPSNNPIPFGQSGLVNPIPATTATAGKASFDLGFPPITMVQKSLGGLAPDGKDLNGILNHIDQHVVWQTAGGRYYYDSVFAAAVGGYAVGAVVQADDNSTSYINTSPSNLTNPNTGGAGWAIWIDRALRTNLAASSGSSLVGFIQAGTGATVRTVQKKLKDSITPFDYGVVADGVTDDTAAWLVCIAAAKSLNKPIVGFTGRSVVNAQLDFSGVSAVRGSGSSNAIFDFSNATGSFPKNSCLWAAGVGLTSLPALTADIVAGNADMTFASAPSVAQGDVIVVFNPTTSSYSSWRTYYYAGEYAEVFNVVGSKINTVGSFYGAYTAASVNVYKMAKSTFEYEGFTVIGNTSLGNQTLSGIGCLLMTSGVFRDVVSTGAYNAGISLVQCYNVSGTMVRAYQQKYNASGVGYGIAISNSQNVNFFGGTYEGSFNAITTGGTSGTGAVPNRNVNFINVERAAQYYDPSNAHQGYAANHHGNAEYCEFSGNFYGAILMGGNNNIYDAHELILPTTHANGAAIQGAELTGINHKVRGKITTYGNSNARGVIDIGAGSVDLSSTSTSGGEFNIDGVQINAPNWTKPAIAVINRGFIGNWSVSAVNVKVNAPNVSSLLTTNNGVSSGTACASVDIHGSGFIGATLPAATVLIVNALSSTLIRGLRCNGRVLVSVISGTATATGTITFPRNMPVGVYITLGLATSGSPVDQFHVIMSASTATGATVTVTKVGGGNFTANITLQIYWSAGLDVGQ